MKKFISYVFYTLLGFCGVIVICYCLTHMDNIVNLVAYPAGGNHYISFYENDEKRIITTVYYKQIKYEGELDFENLELYIRPNRGYVISREDNYSVEKIREYLLIKGLAKISDEKKASVEELGFQNQAIESEVGIWRTGDTNVSTPKFFIMYSKVIDFLFSNVGKILLYVLSSVIGLSVVLDILIKIRSRRRIDVIFMGGISSGKTTLIRRIQSPGLSDGELLTEVSPTHGSDIIQGNRIPYKKKDIYTSLFDNPGDSHGEMVDAINKFKIQKSENKVVVYVISFTRFNSRKLGKELNFDLNLVNSQISKATAMVKMLKTSQSLKKVKKIIVFFNKCDLLYEDEASFMNSYSDIEKKYKEANDFNELKRYADILIYGSALKPWKVNKLMDEITKKD